MESVDISKMKKSQDLVSWEDVSEVDIVEKPSVHSNFLNVQFHNDYRDTITAINNINPTSHKFFNVANKPSEFSEPNPKEVSTLVNSFIKILNNNVKRKVSHKRHANSGWDEAVPDPTVEKSGWEEFQESLGLPPSLYHNPAKKSPVRLIDIKNTAKIDTADESKYNVVIVIQKENVSDQMNLHVSFVVDRNIMKNEDDFYKHTKEEYVDVVIEKIFINGFYSKRGNNSKLEQTDYDINGPLQFEQVNETGTGDIITPKEAHSILKEKLDNIAKENNYLVSNLDEEGQVFHSSLPNLAEFSRIKDADDIYNDLYGKRKFI
jgi:hypothetical protein